jgi:hypothetical protein
VAACPTADDSVVLGDIAAGADDFDGAGSDKSAMSELGAVGCKFGERFGEALAEASLLLACWGGGIDILGDRLSLIYALSTSVIVVPLACRVIVI